MTDRLGSKPVEVFGVPGDLPEVNHPLTELEQVVNQLESHRAPKRGTVPSLVRQRPSLMFRPRSYMAFAITPQPPIVDWLSELDASLGRSEGFFAGQHVALDLSAVNLSSSAIGQLVANLEERNIRVLGIEGVDPAKWQAGLPPVLRGGRGLANVRWARVHRRRRPDSHRPLAPAHGEQQPGVAHD